MNYGTNKYPFFFSFLNCSCWFWKEEGAKLIREVIWRLWNNFVGEDFVGYFNELVGFNYVECIIDEFNVWKTLLTYFSFP